ncbi:MAG TPA: DUF4407 domain-containing protein [Streptosporangiaceae bacterium]|nr:DUF4407 domain-containing protein [Streptosporangiaceae bacterium]
MNHIDGDLVRRSLATAGEEADEKGTARRKARFKASIAALETDPAERARIDSIAASVGLEPTDPAADARDDQAPYQLPAPVSGHQTAWKRTLRRLRRSRQHQAPGPRAVSQPIGWLGGESIVKQAQRDRARVTPWADDERHRAPAKRKMATRFSDYLAWLGGGDPVMLARVPEERARFVQMAGVLLTTSGIAVMSMVFALHDAVNVPALPAAILGLLWGAVIFNLDRFLVLSMGRARDRWRRIWITLPRLALAMVLALVISTPLVLRIFASDINAELVILHQERAKQVSALVRTSPAAEQARQLATRINEDQAILNGHIPESATNPQLQTAQARVAQLQPQVAAAKQSEIRALAAWECQLYGTGANCERTSNATGNGPIAQAKEQQYQQALNAYNTLNGQLQTAQQNVSEALTTLNHQQATALSRYQTQARAELPRLESQHQALENSLQKSYENAAAVSNADTGLLAQLQALSQASAKNPSLEAARLTVLVLFLLIEILPVTVKFLLNLGPPTAYEIAVQHQEDLLARLEEMRAAEELRIETAKSRSRIDVENEMRKREKELGKQANEYVTTEMERILDEAYRQWSSQVRARLPDVDTRI